MKCIYCGSELQTDASHCSSCGAPKTKNSEEKPILNFDNQQVVIVYGKQKHRIIYILLAIFLGFFGIHSFYAGDTLKGTIQLLITLLSFGIGGFFIAIWALTDACRQTHDVNKVPMI